MRRFVAYGVGAAVACVSLLWAEAAAAATPDPSGTAVAVVQATNASGPGGNRVLGVEKPVFGGDRIATGAEGQAQIKFEDETRLVVGSNSSVVIDRFVYDPAASSSGGATMNFTRGTFRFIGGVTPDNFYVLKTPTATIGRRGTKFDITVSAKGTAVAVFEGSVEVCNRISGQCEIVDRSCGAILAKPDGALEVPETAEENAGLVRASFPLAAGRQAGLRRDFRVNTRPCGNRSASKNTDSPDRPRADPEPEPDPHCGPGYKSYKKWGFKKKFAKFKKFNKYKKYGFKKHKKYGYKKYGFKKGKFGKKKYGFGKKGLGKKGKKGKNNNGGDTA